MSGPSGLRLRLLSPPSERGSRMTQDDVLFGYRLQLFALAAERGVSEACRLMGVHRSTYYRWKEHGRAVGVGDAPAAGAAAAADAQPALRDGRAADRRVRARSPGARAAAGRDAPGAPGMGRAGRLTRTASTRPCVRHGLNTRAKRLALVAGYRAPFEPPREPEPEPHIDSERPGRAGRHRLLLRRPLARHQRPGLADRSRPANVNCGWVGVGFGAVSGYRPCLVSPSRHRGWDGGPPNRPRTHPLDAAVDLDPRLRRRRERRGRARAPRRGSAPAPPRPRAAPPRRPRRSSRASAAMCSARAGRGWSAPGVPSRMPDGSNGLRGSNGTVL